MELEKVLREVRIAVGAILTGIMCVKVAMLPDLDFTLNKANIVLDKAAALEDSTHKFGRQLSLDYYNPEDPTNGFYRQIQDSFYNSAQSSKQLTKSIINTDANLNGGKNSEGKQVVGVLPSVTTLITQVDSTVISMQGDLNKLTLDSSDAIQSLNNELKSINTLTVQLNKEVSEGGDVSKTFEALTKTVNDVDKSLSDPNIAKILANAGATSDSLRDAAVHGDSIITTVDDVTLPWRKKIGQVKLILEKVGQLLKFTIPLAK